MFETDMTTPNKEWTDKYAKSLKINNACMYENISFSCSVVIRTLLSYDVRYALV